METPAVSTADSMVAAPCLMLPAVLMVSTAALQAANAMVTSVLHSVATLTPIVSVLKRNLNSGPGTVACEDRMGQHVAIVAAMQSCA